jgi:hypothetical protein
VGACRMEMNNSRFAAGVLVLLFALTLAGCGIVNAWNQGKTAGADFGTMFTLEQSAIALDRYRADHGKYPTATTVAELKAALEPTCISQARWEDNWKHPLLVEVTPEGYLLSSSGEDGEGGHEFEGPVSRPGHSITLRNGVFVQYNVIAKKAAREMEARIAAARRPGVTR